MTGFCPLYTPLHKSTEVPVVSLAYKIFGDVIPYWAEPSMHPPLRIVAHLFRQQRRPRAPFAVEAVNNPIA